MQEVNLRAAYGSVACAVGLLLSANVYAFDPIMVGDNQIQISGFIQADAIYSSSRSLAYAGEAILVPPTIPLDSQPGAGVSQTYFTARASRITFSTRTPVEGTELSTRFEVDALGNDGNEVLSNSNGIRIRIAWVQLGNWGAGQNWSSFIIYPSVPEQNNASALVGNGSPLRQGAFRYTSHGFTVSLENPETTLDSGNSPTGSDRAPDVMLRYDVKGDRVSGAIVGVVRDLTDSTGDSTDMGYGISLGGAISLTAKDQIKLVASKGAIGRFTSAGLFPDAETTPDGDIRALDVLALNVGIEHAWTRTVRSSVQYGYSEADNHYGSEASSKKGSSVMFSSFWNPYPQTRVGFDISRTKRETEGGEEGDLTRVQFAVRQNF